MVKMKERVSRGFTLIELLVVIAIIGLLAAVVLASVGGARNKGADASVKTQMANMRAAAELYAANQPAATANSYEGVCTALSSAAIPGIRSMLDSVNSAIAGGSVLIGATPISHAVQPTDGVICADSSSGWVAQAALSGGATLNAHWCADSTGASRGVTGLLQPNIPTCS